MDMINFTRQKNGMEEEYNKIIRSELDLIYANGNNKDALNERFKELKTRKEMHQRDIERVSLELTLTYRALKEITDNWNKIIKEE